MNIRLVPLVLSLAAFGCESNPAEVKTEANEFPQRASWAAAVTPVGTTTVRANTTIKEFLGSRLQATITVSGAPANAVYQWRIFRGDCATNTPAPSAASPIGLQLVATIQSYPDITTSGGTGTVSREIASALDSLTAYSVRIRAAQSATNWNGTSPLACGNLQRS